ncbi:ubinuclein-1-like isoform X1 [Asterias rubens]|uniref:ubinuclein-1-like isoform X1 n=1 Tax=Asterias rubens TaxID=7604 RepID=UPI001455B5C9|nr:ubinuclein-1-like isoform X1 [Asterias rubens]
MAERRRIIPSSVGPLFPLKKEKETVPTLRFSLTLKEPSDKTCSVFSYCQLVKKAAHKENGIDQSFNELDEDDIGGLESIAKKFEEKYAPKKGKKRKHVFIDELIDVGMGYDDTDPFVDNSECYDELVPDVLTTQLGGFYINQGQLHFRERSDSDNSGDFQDPMRRKKTPRKKHRKPADGDRKEGKRKRNSSSSSDKAAKKMRKQLQRQLGKPGRKKKSLAGRIPTVAELLKQREEAVKHYGAGEDSSKDSIATSNTTKAPSNNASATNGLPTSSSVDVIDLNASLGDIDPSLDLGLIMSDLKMDSDMAAAMEEALKGPMSTDETERGLGSPGPNGDDVLDEDGKSPLPDGLPTSLIVNVDKIKEAARKSVEGKCKFFTASVNNLLLKIENQSRDESCGTRSSLYSHLASNLPCTKETLLKRAKKLRLMAHDSCLKEPLQKLKEAIAKAMPAQLERYTQECQAATQDKYNAMMNKSQPVEEETKTKGTRGQVPSKRFQWTHEIRELLCTIVNVKMQTYKMSKIRTQSAEDYLKMYLEDEIKPLWPNRWMQMRTLFKESRSVHGTITSVSSKPIKILPILKKPTPTKTSTPEALDSSADEPDSRRKPDRPDARLTSPESSSQDSYIPTLLDYASKSHDPQPTSEKEKANPKPSNRPKTTNAPDNAAPRVKDSRDFMDLLIAEQLALHDTPAESQSSQPSKKARVEDAKIQSKREVSAPPSKRMTAEEEAQALQLDILRKASLLLQPQDAWSAESSRKGLSPYADEIKALAQVASQQSSSVAGNSVRNTQSVAVLQKPSSVKMASTGPKTSFQMEFEKMYSTAQKKNSSQAKEVMQTSPAAQQYKTPALQEVSLSGSAKTAAHKTAFEKLRLAGQGIQSVHVDSASIVAQPVVKLTRHANLTGGVQSDAAVYSTHKLVSPPSTHSQQYSGSSSKREPLTSSHRLPQQGNTPAVTSTSQSLPAKIPSSQPLSSAGSLYMSRKDSAFQSVSQAGGDRSVSSKHTGKLVTSPAYTSPSAAYTSPSPPKGSPHSVRTSPYSTSPSQVTPPPSSPRHTSPLGQKPGYSQYQRTSSTSPGHSSSYSTSYPAAMTNLPGYLADLTRKQPLTSPVFAPPTFPMTTGHVSPGHQGSSGRSTSPGDAIITGPAPGTFYHTQNAGNILDSMQSSTSSSATTNNSQQRLLHRQQLSLDSLMYAHQTYPEPHRKQKQHRIP